MIIYEDSDFLYLKFKYNETLVMLCRRIPFSKWDKKKCAWIIKKEFNIYVSKLVFWALRKKIINHIKKINLDVDFDLPKLEEYKDAHNLLLKPFPYQLEGIDYILKHKKVLVSDQPGLGKTLQAIGAIFIAKSFPCLIVCKSALKYNFQKEIKMITGEEAIILDKKNKDNWSDNINFGTKFFITNFEYLKQPFVEEIKKTSRTTIKLKKSCSLFKSLIVDESHYIKSNKTLQTKIIKKISKDKDYRILLTGTPVVNKMDDLIPQLQVLDTLDAFGGYTTFRAKYCSNDTTKAQRKELNFMLWNTCYYRRMKHEIENQLPLKMRQFINVDIENRSEYEACERDLATYLKQYKKESDTKIRRSLNGSILVKMNVLKQIAAKGKLNVFKQFVQKTIDNDEKIVIFGFLKEIVNDVYNEFKDVSVRVTGDENSKQKEASKVAFQKDESVRSIILNFKSGKEGITLTKSSTVAFSELPYTFADCEQAEDRVHRIGQTKNVQCYYFIARNTIDEHIMNLINNKKALAEDVAGGEDITQESTIQIALSYFENKKLI